MRLLFLFLVSIAFTLSAHAQGPQAHTVLEISASPDPETTPYADCLVAVKCRAVVDGTERVLLFDLFRDRVRFPAFTLKKEQVITVTPIPFEKAPQIRQVMQANDFFDPTLKVYYATNWEPQIQFEAELATTPQEESVASSPSHTDVIRRSLIAHGQDVTGGRIDDFHFWVHTPRVLETDFWKHPQLSKKGAIGAREAILRFHRSLDQLGIQLVLAVVPRSTSIYPGIATNIPYDPDIDGPVNQPVRDLLADVAKEGVTSVDLTSTFLEQRYVNHEETAYPVYRRNDSHWSGAGVKLAAEAIAAKVGGALTPLAAGSVTAETITAPYSMPVFHGKTPRDPKPETELIFRVDTSENEALFDPFQRDAAIHLIGDSFVNYGGQGAGAYGLQPHLVRLLGQPVNVFAAGSGGPMISRGQFVRAADLEATKTVVWVFAESFLAPADIWFDVPVAAPSITHLEFSLDAAAPTKSTGEFSPMEGLGSGIELSEAGSIVWEAVEIGPRAAYPKFSAFVELKAVEGTDPAPAEATFSVLADGVELASKTVPSDRSSTRSPQWTIGLKKLAGQNVSLELRATVVTETPDAWRLRWTLPQLTNAGFAGEFTPKITDPAAPAPPALLAKPQKSGGPTRLYVVGVSIAMIAVLVFGFVRKRRGKA